MATSIPGAALALRVADIEGDGVHEVLFGRETTSWEHGGFVLDGPSGGTCFGVSLDIDDGQSVLSMDAADADGDGAGELVWKAGYLDLGHTSTRIRVAEAYSAVDEGQTFESGWVLPLLAVADLDADGRTEVLWAPATTSEPAGTGWDDRWITVSDLHHGTDRGSVGTGVVAPSLARAPIVVAQLDGDPQLECVATASFNLVAWDGADDSGQWASEEIYDTAVSALAAGDVDDDSAQEVLAIVGRQVVLYSGATGAEIWRSAELTSPGGAADLRIADVDGDGQTELLSAMSGDGVRVFDGRTRAEEWSCSLPEVSALETADVDGDLDLDILMGDTLGRLRAVEGATKADLFEDTVEANRTILTIRVTDLDGDGAAEVVLTEDAGSSLSALKVLRASDRAALWQSPPLAGKAGLQGSLSVKDADDDGLLEICVATTDSVRFFEYGARGPDATPPVFDGPPGLQSFQVSPAGDCCLIVTLAWNGAFDDQSPTVSYRVYRDTAAGFTPGPANLVGRTFLPWFQDAGVEPETEYHYVVRAVDGAGNEDSNPVALSVLTGAAPAIERPDVAAVTDLDPCNPQGLEIAFTYPGDPTGISFDLIVDGEVVGSDIDSPAHHDPGDGMTHHYRIRATRAGCSRAVVSLPMAASDLGTIPKRPVITGITDLNACLTDGLELSFTHAGFPTAGYYELLRDGVVVETPVVSPCVHVPPDDDYFSYVVRAVETGCAHVVDSYDEASRDANRVPMAAMQPRILDADPCARSLATLRFQHPGFPEAGRFELLRDGAVFLTPV